MALSSFRFSGGLPFKKVEFVSTAVAQRFTGNASFTVPAGCTQADLVVVGGGEAAGVRANGGYGGKVVQQTVSVNAGETLTIVVGGAGSSSSVSGSFGTVTATVSGGAAGGGFKSDGADGTTTIFGTFGGGGGGGGQDVYDGDRCGFGGHGGGGGGWMSLRGGRNGVVNTGGGGGGTNGSNTVGGSGFVGIFVR